MLMFVAIAVVVFHAAAWPLGEEVAAKTARDPHAVDLYVATAFAFVMPWIVSHALTNATRSLYSRGDLDPILASPASAGALFAARALAIALESVTSVAIFLLPIADVLAIAAGPHWLAIYPMLAICGLFGTAIGLLAALGLFRIVGPRRTRTLSQVFATIIGATFAIGIQVGYLAPPWFGEGLRAIVGSPASPLHAILEVPVRAATGDGVALAMLAGLAIVAFALVTRGLGVVFARGLVQTRDAPTGVTRSRGRVFRFGPNAALRRKEWRLLLRDPWLASQMLVQVAYTVPLCFVLWETLGPSRGVAIAVAPGVVVIATQMAGALAWITLSSEDAPEFLATAPVSRGEIARAKLTAVAVPLGAVLAVPIAILAVAAPLAALATLSFTLAGAVSTALLNLWRPVPGKRGDVLRRHGQSKLVGILEHTLALSWAVAVALFLAGSATFLVPSAIALIVLFANRTARPVKPRRPARPLTRPDRVRSA